ncbi:hypothetical protein PLCT2_02574 [Planctomycetaceae bacterium]|nr:hypothetical protein PLCT2_02574 [Planctomycetaceae bacterium]
MIQGVENTQFGLDVCHGKVERFIPWAERGLRSIKRTPFHCVLGRDFLGQIEPASAFLVDAHRRASKDLKVAALYCEMNEFDINTDEWHFHVFAYKKAGDIWDYEWLAYWNYSTEDRFVLKGMKPVERAFANHDQYRRGEVKPLQLELAASIAGHLVCARFVQLIAHAHKLAKRRYLPLRKLPVIATAHEWDSMAQTE